MGCFTSSHVDEAKSTGFDTLDQGGGRTGRQRPTNGQASQSSNREVQARAVEFMRNESAIDGNVVILDNKIQFEIKDPGQQRKEFNSWSFEPNSAEKKAHKEGKPLPVNGRMHRVKNQRFQDVVAKLTAKEAEMLQEAVKNRRSAL
eukprot:gb/GFBE01065688.1/.p1 GENE.gb/GFBE01065688.1/~~gb/GFBE01065688.1/.p1  ORF type:complete len:146 (+),score=28.37 gb/GFBE01065688.1/:1-438(+)